MSKPQDIVLLHFGKGFRKHLSVFFADLFTIDIGLKPSVLLDYACVDVRKLKFVIETLYDSGYLENKLRILQVDNFEILIFNAAKLLLHLQKLRENMFLIINVSASVRTPFLLPCETANELVDITLNSLSGVLQSSDDVVQINPDHYVNRSTLFGMLLGYPVIYWYEADDGKDKKVEDCTCLSLVPLNVHKLKLTFRSFSQKSLPNILNILDGKEHVFYSFSYPVDCSVADLSVHSWITKLDSLVAAQANTSLSHEMKVVCMETVVL